MKSAKWLSMFVPLLLVSAGCASVPMASKDDDAAAKRFDVPADKARIYVYRNEVMGAAIKIPITLDGKLMGSTASQTFFVFDVSPGSHEVGCVAETSSKVTVDARAGRAAFVWQEMKMGMLSAGCAMQIVDEQRGRADIAGCTLAAPQ